MQPFYPCRELIAGRGVDALTDKEATCMRELWLQVLRSGLEDAMQGKEDRWIGSKGFREVCDLAGLEPDHVELRFQRKPEAPSTGMLPRRGARLHL